VRERSQRHILKCIRRGQRGACEALVCQHYEEIYSFLVYLTGDTVISEDLTQESFASAWANIEHYKGKASFGTWLHKIAYHKFIDSKRNFNRRTALMDKLAENGLEKVETLNPLDSVIADESLLCLYNAVNKLDSSDRIVIILHYIQGLGFREISKVLDKPIGTVKWQGSRALKKLKVLLTGGS